MKNQDINTIGNSFDFNNNRQLLAVLIYRLKLLYQLYLNTQLSSKPHLKDTVNNLLNKKSKRLNKVKRYKISEMQLQLLLNHFLIIKNKISASEFIDNETNVFKFDLNKTLLYDFLTFINGIPELRVFNVQFISDEAIVTIKNLGDFDQWNQVFEFHEQLTA